MEDAATIVSGERKYTEMEVFDNLNMTDSGEKTCPSTSLCVDFLSTSGIMKTESNIRPGSQLLRIRGR